MTDRQHQLKQIYRAYAHNPAFDRLRSHGPHKRVVPGRGSMFPRFIIVGEAPGRSEALERKPFMGKAGLVLNGLLSSIGVDRRDIFITNVVKYRPTIGELSIRNRTPSPDEIEASRPYLMDELAVFGNTPVAVLGNTPLRALLYPRPKPRISDWHGQGFYDSDRMYVALYHPAVAVYDPTMMDTLLDDMARVREMLR